MAKFLSLFIVFFSLNILAQNEVTSPLSITAAATSLSDDQFVPTADQCYKAANQVGLYPDFALVVRLAKFDFSEVSKVYLDTWLCEDKNSNNCVPIKRSNVAEEKVPLSLGIASRDIGCLLAYGEHNKKSYKYLAIQIFESGRVFDTLIHTDYVNIANLKNFNTVETPSNGILLTFPISMNRSMNGTK